MGFHEDALFPVDISYGSTTGPGFNTRIVRVDSGAEEPNSRWSAPIHQYNAAYGLREYVDVWRVRQFFNVRRGAANGFRFRDWGDYTSNPTFPADTDLADFLSDPSNPPAAVLGTYPIANTDQQIGVGDGTTTTFQLVKNYTDGSSAPDLVRPIFKPVSGTVVVALDSVNQSSGWSVNTTNGQILFATAPGTDVVVTAGFQFDVPCRFGEDVDKALQVSLTAFEAGDIPDIPIVELRTPAKVYDDFYPGGAKNFGTIATDTAWTMLDGFALTFEPATTGHAAIAPPLSDVPSGGPIAIIMNEGSETLACEDSEGGTIVSGGITAGNNATLLVSKNSSNQKTWYAY